MTLSLKWDRDRIADSPRRRNGPRNRNFKCSSERVGGRRGLCDRDGHGYHHNPGGERDSRIGLPDSKSLTLARPLSSRAEPERSQELRIHNLRINWHDFIVRIVLYQLTILRPKTDVDTDSLLSVPNARSCKSEFFHCIDLLSLDCEGGLYSPAFLEPPPGWESACVRAYPRLAPVVHEKLCWAWRHRVRVEKIATHMAPNQFLSSLITVAIIQPSISFSPGFMGERFSSSQFKIFSKSLLKKGDICRPRRKNPTIAMKDDWLQEIDDSGFTQAQRFHYGIRCWEALYLLRLNIPDLGRKSNHRFVKFAFSLSLFQVVDSILSCKLPEYLV